MSQIVTAGARTRDAGAVQPIAEVASVAPVRSLDSRAPRFSEALGRRVREQGEASRESQPETESRSPAPGAANAGAPADADGAQQAPDPALKEPQGGATAATSDEGAQPEQQVESAEPTVGVQGASSPAPAPVTDAASAASRAPLAPPTPGGAPQRANVHGTSANEGRSPAAVEAKVPAPASGAALAPASADQAPTGATADAAPKPVQESVALAPAKPAATATLQSTATPPDTEQHPAAPTDERERTPVRRDEQSERSAAAQQRGASGSERRQDAHLKLAPDEVPPAYAALRAEAGRSPAHAGPREAGAATTAPTNQTDAASPARASQTASSEQRQETRQEQRHEQRGGHSGAASDHGRSGRSIQAVNPAANEDVAAPDGASTFTTSTIAKPALPSSLIPGEAQASPEALRTAAESVARGLAAAVNQRGGTIVLRLSPESLGLVRIHMSIEQGSVSVRMEATNPSAHGLLSQNLAMLRGSLESRGLTVDKLSVQLAPAGAAIAAPAGPVSAAPTSTPSGESHSAWQDAAENPSQGGRDSEEQDAQRGRSGQEEDAASPVEAALKRGAFSGRLRMRLETFA